MSKVTVIGYRPVMDEVVEALQHAGALEVVADAYDLQPEEVAPDDERMRLLDEQVAEAHFVRDFLGRYHTNEQPFSTFVTEKFHLPRAEYLRMAFDTRGKRLYRECVGISDKLAAGEREHDRLTQLVRELAPWAELRFQIKFWKGTETTALFTGTVPASSSERIRQALRDATPEVSVEEMGPVGDRQAWVVIAHHCCADEARAVLSANDFQEVTFPGLSDYPAEEIAHAEARLADLAEQEAGLKATAQRLSDEHYDRSVALVEAIDSQRDRLAVRRSFGRTERAFVISGWIPVDHQGELEAALAPFSEDVDLTLDEPGEDDSVPVELRNPKWLRPFEVLTDLYGRPQYGELDPTPLLAPFFLAFFAICIGDVGYGLMLVVGCWLIKTRLDVTVGVKRFLTLMVYGGFAAMVVGVLFGSYMALPLTNLPAFMVHQTPAGLRAYGQLLDPLGQLTTFLIITLVLGVVQVFFGVFVAAFDAFRRGDPQGAVFGQLSTIFLFAMIAAFAMTKQGLFMSFGLVGTMVMQGGAIQAALGDAEKPVWDRALGWLWLAVVVAGTVMMGIGMTPLGLGLLGGASVAGALASKTARSAVIALLGGAYSVYGMSAFVGDTLSYTRLAALGLSGSLVGFVFNLLAGLVWSPAMALFGKGGFGIVFGVLVALMAAAVFVVGHVFNVVINLLGAFVHPARLQFVEFFSKFYEGGGRPFSPFKVRTENLVLEAGGAGSEGGAG